MQGFAEVRHPVFDLVRIFADMAGGDHLMVVVVGMLKERRGCFFDALQNERRVLAGNVHHILDRLADDLVQWDDHDQGDQRPQAAAGHGNVFVLIELLDRFLIGFFVISVFELQQLDLRRDTRHFHHALLALGTGRIKNQLQDQGEQDEGQAVVCCPVVQPLQHIAKWDFDNIPKAEC